MLDYSDWFFVYLFTKDEDRKNSSTSLLDREKLESDSNNLLKDTREQNASASQLNEDNISTENEVLPKWTVKSNDSGQVSRVFNVISRDMEVVDEQPSFMSSGELKKSKFFYISSALTNIKYRFLKIA